MKLYGLVGYPLSHSFSAQYFSEKFFKEEINNCRYDLFPIENINKLLPLIDSNKELHGLNITIPYKQSVLPFISFLDPVAKEISAVNTIKIEKRKKIILHGFNTDIFGFEGSIKPLLLKHHRKALILGSGGSSKAVAFVLSKLGIEFSFVSRNKTVNASTFDFADLNEEIISLHNIIINTTPLGMFPYISESPDIPYNFITKSHLMFDLIYNPSETQFMKKGIKKGATVSNGLQMLYLQAEKSWQIWNE